MSLHRLLRRIGHDLRLLTLVEGFRGWDCSNPQDRLDALNSLICSTDANMNRPGKLLLTYETKFGKAAGSVAFDRMKSRYRGVIADSYNPGTLGQPSSRKAVVRPLQGDADEGKCQICQKVVALSASGVHLTACLKESKERDLEVFCQAIEAYGQLVISYASTYGRLDGLNCHTGDAHLALPSWIPNFHSKKRMHSLIEHYDPNKWLHNPYPVFYASGTSQPVVRRHDAPFSGTVEIVGRVFDTVQFTTAALGDGMPERMIPVPSLRGAVQGWADEVSPIISTFGPGAYGRDFETAVRLTAVAGRSTERDPYIPEQATTPPTLPTRNGQDTFIAMALHYPGPVFRAVCGRRPMSTEMVLIGLGPASVRAGDMICLLFGGQTPYVVRPNDDGTWKFVGECYVHGIMNGEVMEESHRPEHSGESYPGRSVDCSRLQLDIRQRRFVFV